MTLKKISIASESLATSNLAVQMTNKQLNVYLFSFHLEPNQKQKYPRQKQQHRLQTIQNAPIIGLLSALCSEMHLIKRSICLAFIE